MKHLEEQRVCVKFCFKVGKTFTETFQMLQQARTYNVTLSHVPVVLISLRLSLQPGTVSLEEGRFTAMCRICAKFYPNF